MGKNIGEVELISEQINQTEQSSSSIYRLIWRWHFYAGMFAAPFMIILAITGGIYLFKPIVEDFMKQPYQHVQVGSRTLSIDEQISEVKRIHPEYTVTSYGPPEGDGFSARIGVTKDSNEFFTVFVNPYDGQILGEFHGSFMAFIRKIHGTLLLGGAGGAGDTLIELAACWGIILTITGLYLWFPRGKKSIFGTLLPRFNNGKRVFWRDLHSIPAFWFSIVIVVLVLSGLPWTGFFGNKILQPIETQTHTGSPLGTYPGEPIPQSKLVTKDVTHSTDTPWAIEKVPVPDSDITGHSPKQPIRIEKVLQIAKDQNVPRGYTINFPEGPTGVYSIFALQPGPKLKYWIG